MSNSSPSPNPNAPPPIVYILGLLAVFSGGFLLWQNLGGRSSPNPTAGPASPASPDSPTDATETSPADTTARPRGRTLTLEPQPLLRQVAGVPEGVFNYGGSTTWAPIRGEIDRQILAVWPEFTLVYRDPISGNPGSGAGIKMLLDNQLAFAQSSRSLKPEEYAAAQQRGFTLVEVPVAIDAIAMAVHPDQTSPGLTIAQLRDIYRGTITNWNQVGGPDLPITPYSRRPEAGGTVQFFIKNVVGDGGLGPTVQWIGDTTEAIRAVARNPGGLYYASVPEVVPQCTIKPLPVGRAADRLVPPYAEPLVPPADCPARRNEPNGEAFQSGDYPITRRLFVIVKQDGQADQRAGEAYVELMLTDQGQAMLDLLGFVRIR